MRYTKNVRKELEIENPDALLADGFDDALIGIGGRMGSVAVAVYDHDKCIDILQQQGMYFDEAVEYFEFNVVGSWFGENTPIFLDTLGDAWRNR